MTIKSLFVTLLTVGIFSIPTAFVYAQEDALVCCQFNATGANANELAYCQMVSSCAVSNLTSPAGKTIIPDTVQTVNGDCVNDYNKKATPPNYGTHCQADTVQTNSTSNVKVCGPETTLSDCIANRLPNKNGSVGANRSTTGLVNSVALLVNTVLGIVGLIFTIMLVYAGIQWIHYGGDGDGKKKAIKRIRNAVIGLTITLSAYGITAFVFNNLSK